MLGATQRWTISDTVGLSSSKAGSKQLNASVLSNSKVLALSICVSKVLKSGLGLGMGLGLGVGLDLDMILKEVLQNSKRITPQG